MMSRVGTTAFTDAKTLQGPRSTTLRQRTTLRKALGWLGDCGSYDPCYTSIILVGEGWLVRGLSLFLKRRSRVAETVVTPLRGKNIHCFESRCI